MNTNVNLVDQSQNLGPSALDSLLTQSSQPTSSRNPGLRRGPVSRGGVGLQTSSNEDRRIQSQSLGGRGRLQVLDNTRPPLQPQPEDEIQDEFLVAQLQDFYIRDETIHFMDKFVDQLDDLEKVEIVDKFQNHLDSSYRYALEVTE